MKRIILPLIICLCVISVYSGALCQLSDSTDSQTIKIATGKRRGGYYAIGAKVKELSHQTDIRLAVHETQGSRDALQSVCKGEAEFAFAQ
ncbi:MAG: hypothetical protein JSU69_06335, partial [Candidatus Zixiibacteriota bacterium]